MPAIQSCFIEPLWEQFSALLPEHTSEHPLGCHRGRIPDRVVFDALVEVTIFGAAYWRIAKPGCSATTLRRRRDEWMKLGVMDQVETDARESYDRMIGLQLEDVAVDGCIAKAPCGGELAGPSPVDRAKQGMKRSNVVDAKGIPLGTVPAPANRHDSPLLAPTLDTLGDLVLPPGETSVHVDRGYDSNKTENEFDGRGLQGCIARKGNRRGKKVSHKGLATTRWVVERTNSWQNAFKKLVWCTERKTAVIRFYIAFANAIIIVRRLVREGWKRYRWTGRPARCP